MVSFVYLDVGGVAIIDFSDDPRKWDSFMRRIGVKDKDFERFSSFWHGLEDEINVGRDLQTLIPLINRRFGCGLPKSYPLLAEFVDGFTQNKAIWSGMHRIRREYGMGLLTNMYPHMFEGIRKRRLLP